MKQTLYIRTIKNELASRIESNPAFSLRSFARKLGFSPSTLSQVLSGNRPLSFKMAQKVVDALDLSPEQAAAFLRSVAQEQAARPLERKRSIPSAIHQVLDSAGAVDDEETREIEEERFRVISEWYHYAILELTFVKPLSGDPEEIATALGISTTEAKLAVSRLMDLGLLKKAGRHLVKANAQIRTGTQHRTSAAHRKRQKQLLAMSAQAIDRCPIELRNHTAMTLSLDRSKIPEAKGRIQKFLRELGAFLESGKREDVYELTINLFPLTKNPGESR